MPNIIAKSLTKLYGTSKVLDSIDIEIEKGKFTAIIGRSGSGKSTLLNLLSGLDKPSSGEVLFDEKNISYFNDRKLSKFRNRKIGFVFQFFYLQPFLSVQKNIEIAAFPARISRKQRANNAKRLAKMVGLEDKVNKYPRELSGGEIQRVAIARALMNSPEILFADEPTGNLDSENSGKIINFLIELSKRNNLTLVMVTHDLEIAAKADNIIHLIDGKVKI